MFVLPGRRARFYLAAAVGNVYIRLNCLSGKIESGGIPGGRVVSTDIKHSAVATRVGHTFASSAFPFLIEDAPRGLKEWPS